MRIGIDFGTTHTSAAYYDGKTIQFVPLDKQNANPSLLRSLIYITRSHQVYLGVEAARRFLQQDTGRPVVYAEKVVGTLTNTVASHDYNENVTIVYDTVIDEDIGAKGRLLQSIKTGLRSDFYKGTNIFGRYYTVQELIALLLRQVRTQAETYWQREVRQVVLGRPVQFAEDPAADQRAEQRLREAATLAGFEEISFVYEPVAASAFYLNQIKQPETVLIFDFGGGTLDLTLLRVDAHGTHQVLANDGVLVGGDDLDSAIMHHCVASYFGAAAPIDKSFDGRSVLFPEELALLLDHWQTIPLLSRQQSLGVIHRAQKYSPEATKFAALATLVTQNLGFALFEHIEQAKRTLSDQEVARLTMQTGAIDLDTEIARRDFHLAIADALSQARAGVREILTKAGIAASEVNAVATTGGSSVIPVFQKMLIYEFPGAQLVPLDTFSGVAGGLAIHAQEV